MVKDDKPLNVSEIARDAGCNRSYLYESEVFMAFLSQSERGTAAARIDNGRPLGSD